MIKTRGRKIIQDVLSRKGRTVLVALSIMIGVFGAVTLISVDDLIIKQIKQDIRSDEIAMTRLFVTVPTAGTEVDNEAYLNLLQEMPGVTDVQGQVISPVFWKTADAPRFRDGNIMAFSSPFGEIKLEPMRLIEGNWPQPGQHEIAIETRMADEYGLNKGDKLTFRSLGTADEAEWTITGIVFHPYWVGGEGENDTEQRIYANYDDAQSIAGFSGFNMTYLRYTDTGVADAQAETLMQTVREQTSYIPAYYWLDDPDDYFLIDEVKQVTNVLDMLAVVSLIVSGFLVTNVINTIIVEQKRQIGVMKSLGATRMDTFIVYAGIALAYGILGTIPGVILGILAGSAMAQALDTLASTLIEGFKVSTIGILIGVVMGLLVPVIASLIPVFNGTRVSIIDAMTDLGISVKWGRGPMARLIKALPLPANIRQALSNVVQKKGRLALTVITLTLAAAAFMGVFAMFTLITNEIDKLYDTFDYEITIVPNEPQDFEQVRTQVKSIEGVEEVLPGVAFNVDIIDLGETVLDVDTDTTTVPAFGFDPSNSPFHLTYEEGTGWNDDPNRDGLVLTKPAANLLDKKLGDRVVVSAGGAKSEYEIIGIASYPFDIAILPWQELARLAGFVTSDNGTPNDYTDDEALPTAYLVTLTEDNLKASQVEDVVGGISDSLVASGITAQYINEVQSQEDASQEMMTFNMIFQLTSAVMAAVGAIGLLTTLSMAVFERQKEIGVMRSIGARSATIISQFQVEGIVIGLIAWLLAIPLSYLLGQALLNSLGFKDFIEFNYPIWVIGLGLVGMLIVAVVASLWPSLAASRKTVSDILRYQ